MARLRAQRRGAKAYKKQGAAFSPPPPRIREGLGDPNLSSRPTKSKPIPLEVRLAEALDVIRRRWEDFNEADQPDCLLAGYGCEQEEWYTRNRPEAKSRSLGKFNQAGLCDWCYKRIPAYSAQGGLPIEAMVREWLDTKSR